MDVRTRMAPAPTGFLHVGTARTAIFNWLFARKQKGAFIVRIEDTDKERSKKEFEEDILEGFRWLGLKWDERYRQSERIEIYNKYLTRLLEEGKAFWCPHTKEELEAETELQRATKESPRHHCNARDEQRKSGELIRLKNPLGEKICFNDIVRGEICFESDLISDISLAKDLQTPLYNFAAVADDYEMHISHVIRGEDHISNTPKQILIGRALGFQEPIWAHMALTLGKDRSKLSKRHGATALREYQEQGYLPEAMFNYLALLGWNPGDEREIMSREELIEAFSLERLQKSGAIFDVEKLNWMNGEYIRKTSLSRLVELSEPFFSDVLRISNFQNLPSRQIPWLRPSEVNVFTSDPISKQEYIKKIIELEQSRTKKLSDLKESTRFFFERPEYDRDLLRWKGSQEFTDIKKHLEAIKKIISENGDVMAYADREGRGEVLWPLRVALSGRKASPGPFEIMEVLGKEEVLARIDIAISLIKKEDRESDHSTKKFLQSNPE